jgi:phage tail sheath protein FI
MFINIHRMFNYVANTCVLTYWSRIDENLTRRYAESITDELNIWLNRLVSTGALLGARCELKAEENPDTDLMAGIIRVHVYMTPPSPAQEVDFLLEYDADYVSSILGG